MPPTLPPSYERSKPEEPQPPYSDVLRQLLTDIAGCDKRRLTAESNVETLLAKLAKKEMLGAKDLATLTQVSESHKSGEQAKQDIDKHVKMVNQFTSEPLRQVLLRVPLSLSIGGYVFTLSTAPNSVNSWMLDLTVAYHPA